MDHYSIIKKSVTTEKSATVSSENKYTFLVDLKANKIEVAKAITKIYGVKPVQVNMLRTPKKFTGQGRLKRKAYKKALVTLKKGDKIDPIKFKK